MYYYCELILLLVLSCLWHVNMNFIQVGVRKCAGVMNHFLYLNAPLLRVQDFFNENMNILLDSIGYRIPFL